MLPLLISLTLAMTFGLLSHAFLGHDALLTQAWIDGIFWAIIGSGVALASMPSLACIGCKLGRITHLSIAQRTHCAGLPC